MNRNICLIILFFCLSLSAFGQLVQSEQVLTKYKDGFLQIRWEPTSIAEWKASQEAGYTVEIYQTNNRNAIQSKIIKQSPFNHFEKRVVEVNDFKRQFFEGSQKLLYPGNFSDGDDQIQSYFANEKSEGIDSLRLGFLIYSSIYDFELTQMIGLGTSFPVSQGVNYTVNVKVDGFPTITKSIMTVNQKREIAELKGEWGDEVVNLEWIKMLLRP